jgi:small GTP-binding protein
MLDDGTYSFRYVLIGDSDVGKSRIIRHFSGCLGVDPGPTVGVDFASNVLDVNGRKAYVRIWDTAGNVRFRQIVRLYIQNVAAVLLVYTSTSRDSFDMLSKYWVPYIESHDLHRQLRVVIVSTNASVGMNREVTSKEGSNFSRSKGYMFYEVSVCTGDGVDEMVSDITSRILNDVRLARIPSDELVRLGIQRSA